MAGNEVSSLFPCSAKLNRYGANIKKKKKNSFLAEMKLQTGENYTYVKRNSPFGHILSKRFDILNLLEPMKEAK